MHDLKIFERAFSIISATVLLETIISFRSCTPEILIFSSSTSKAVALPYFFFISSAWEEEIFSDIAKASVI